MHAIIYIGKFIIWPNSRNHQTENFAQVSSYNMIPEKGRQYSVYTVNLLSMPQSLKLELLDYRAHTPHAAYQHLAEILKQQCLLMTITYRARPAVVHRKHMAH